MKLFLHQNFPDLQYINPVNIIIQQCNILIYNTIFYIGGLKPKDFFTWSSRDVE